MNSLATEKEIDTERSAPRFDNALVVTPADIASVQTTTTVQTTVAVAALAPQPLFRSPLAPTCLSTKTVNRVAHHVLKRAALDVTRVIDGPLLRRLDENAYLQIISGFLALRESASTKRGGKRKSCERGVAAATSECIGVVYGCCLGSLVAYLNMKNVSIAFTVRKIEAILTPIAALATRCYGVDAMLLCRGLASSRMLRTQLSYTRCQHIPTMHSRNGHPLTMIGVSASIFVVFSILSSSMLDSVTTDLKSGIDWMLDNHSLERVLQTAAENALGAVPVDGFAAAPSFEVDAVDAEHRALQRALCGVVCARSFSSQHNLSNSSTFRKMLEFYSLSAWPAGELLNERTHSDVLLRLKNVDYYSTNHQSFQCTHSDVSAFDIIPLEQLTGLTEKTRQNTTASDSSSAVTGSSSNLSSISSAYGSADVADVGDVAVVADVERFLIAD